MADSFIEALAHHQAGRLQQAANMYRRLLAADPQQTDSRHLLGVIAHQLGNDAQAVELIQQAIQYNPSAPSYYVNLATALRGLGRHGEAIARCERALELQPNLAEARLALGLSLQAMKRFAEAEEQFRHVAGSLPGDSRGPQALANCLREQDRIDEAAVQYQEALSRNPDDAAARLGLGTLLLRKLQPDAAEAHLRRATELQPGMAGAWQNLGVCLMRLAREKEAVRAFETALERAPNDAALAVNLGQAWLACGDTTKAENCFRAVHDVRPDASAALAGMGEVKRALDRPEEAIPLFERALGLNAAGDASKGLADALWESDQIERALEVLKRRIDQHPGDAEDRVRLAVMLASSGDLEGSAAACRSALQVRPGYPPALLELAQTERGKLPAADRAELEASLHRPMPEHVRGGVQFALAQLADADERYEQAAEHLRQANALTKKYHEEHGRGYDPAKFERDIDRLIAEYSPDLFARLGDVGVADERPVFVVGMPRSGTTLVEQILAGHPQVYGAGERRFASLAFLRAAERLGCGPQPMACVPRLSREIVKESAEWHLEQLRQLDGGKAIRVVDKMPENYLYLGWLALLFPKARFIHCRRDLRDVALSCWMTNFSRARWADDLRHIAGRIKTYQRVMEHWRRVSPVAWFELEYERLVVETELQGQKLIDWLGLTWDPACLEFHRSKRLVKTASVSQVRQPIYTRSIGRWRRYEAALGPVLDAMESPE